MSPSRAPSGPPTCPCSPWSSTDSSNPTDDAALADDDRLAGNALRRLVQAPAHLEHETNIGGSLGYVARSSSTERDAKLDTVHEQLVTAVGALTTETVWRRALEFAGRFTSRKFSSAGSWVFFPAGRTIAACRSADGDATHLPGLDAATAAVHREGGGPMTFTTPPTTSAVQPVQASRLTRRGILLGQSARQLPVLGCAAAAIIAGFAVGGVGLAWATPFATACTARLRQWVDPVTGAAYVHDPHANS